MIVNVLEIKTFNIVERDVPCAEYLNKGDIFLPAGSGYDCLVINKVLCRDGQNYVMNVMVKAMSKDAKKYISNINK